MSSAANYQRLTANNKTLNPLLQKLYDTDPKLFEPAFIDLIISIGNKSGANFGDLGVIHRLSDSTVFSAYAEENNKTTLIEMDEMLKSYFTTITTPYPTVNGDTLRSRILTLLKLCIKINSATSAFQLSNATVSVTSDWVDDKKLDFTNYVDVCNLSEQQWKLAQNNDYMSYNYTPSPVNIELIGPSMTQIVSAMLLLQEEILNSAHALGVDVQPYVNVLD